MQEFLKDCNVSLPVTELLIEAGIDGEMLFSYTKQDYSDMNIGLKVGQIYQNASCADVEWKHVT